MYLNYLQGAFRSFNVVICMYSIILMDILQVKLDKLTKNFDYFDKNVFYNMLKVNKNNFFLVFKARVDIKIDFTQSKKSEFQFFLN